MVIVDLSRVLAGPWATMHLADQGATVIKVEPPGGDDTRAFGPHQGQVSTYYLAANRNKRSIQLDLRQAGDRAILHRLVCRADVVVQNFRPGVAERLGCDDPSLRALKPDLVNVVIQAFNPAPDAPDRQAWASRPGYDLALQAMGGAMAITGHPGDPPTKCGTSIADLMTGMFAVQAILTGLLHRERTGEGQRIVVDMMQAQAHALAYHGTRWSVLGTEDQPRGNGHAGLVPYDVYRCADGWLAVAVGNDALFVKLCAVLGIQPSPGWATNPGRVADRQAVDAVVQAALAPLTVAQADASLAGAGVPVGPVLSPGQTLSHPAVRTVDLAHPQLGPLTLPAPVFTTLTTRARHDAPPSLDGDRSAILAWLEAPDDRPCP